MRERPWRLYVVLALLGAYAAIVAGKLFYLQVVRHDHFRELAKEEHWWQQEIVPPRGSILASDGAPLATSVPYESLYADARSVRDPASVAAALAPLLGRAEEDLRARLNTEDHRPVVLARFVPAEVSRQVRALRVPGLYWEAEPRRMHPQGNLAAHLIGFVGMDHQGLSGLEMGWGGELGGKPGSLIAEVDTAGQEIALGLRDYRAPVRGADVVTTIDRYAQLVAERELDAAVRRHEAEGGNIVVLDPKTGAVLAVASRPTFALDDPDLFTPEREHLYRCPAVSDLYEPGSVFKVITLAAGVDAGAVAPDDIFNDEGFFSFGGVTVRNWNGVGHGWQTMAQILQRSLNTGSSYVATKLGNERFYRYVRAFGFGELTDVDLPGEAPGLVRSDPAEGWSPSDLLTNSFGQGIAVTPLQMARAVAVVANDGKLMKPMLVSELRSPEGTRQLEPQVVRRVISPHTAGVITDMMVQAVEESVVGRAAVPGHRVAGKSGTAEMLISGAYSPDATIASFAGFAPADEPRYVVLVMIVRPQDNIWGEAVAAPVFSKVMGDLLSRAGVAPSMAAR